jgi:hypothetical protein
MLAGCIHPSIHPSIWSAFYMIALSGTLLDGNQICVAEHYISFFEVLLAFFQKENLMFFSHNVFP